MDIRAAVARTPNGALSIETVQLDEPRADEIRVKLVATGVCHTDIAIVEQLVPLPLPMVLGHEGAGIVDAVGSDVTTLAPGDPVVLAFGTCGTCANCEDGHPAYCDSFPILNLSGRRADGSTTVRDAAGDEVNSAFFGQSSFATYAVAKARNAVKVRADAPLELLGPLGCGLMTGAGTVLNVLQPRTGTSFGVFGTGALGFAALFAAKVAGCQRIVAVDRVASRLDLAKEFGAETINTAEEDLAERLIAIGGLDYAIDTTGVPSVVEAAIQALKPRGTCALVGASDNPVFSVDIMSMISGKTITGVVEGDSDPATFVPRLVDLFLDGDFPIDRIVRQYPLAEINVAIEDARRGTTVKPIIRFA